MRKSITKFDLEAAFKALDEIAIPNVGGVKARRAPLNEVFTRKSRTDALIEEYYDISNNDELDDAQKAREAEVAAAKLARIEKIVDLDAKTPEDLLTTYVGKFIMQCPQCMTLFYKDKEDIEESDDDATVVNVNEVCQHCGNESGYTLVGKVGAADEPETDTETSDDESVDGEALDLELTDEEESASDEADKNTEDTDGEETGETTSTEEDGASDNLDELDLDFEIEDDEGSTAEESFMTSGGSLLTESAAQPTLSTCSEDFRNAVLDVLVSDDRLSEAQLFSKLAVKTIDSACNEAFETATVCFDNKKCPTVIYLDSQLLNIPYEQAAETIGNALAKPELHAIDLPNSFVPKTESLTEAPKLDLDVSESEFQSLISSPAFKVPVSDKATRAMLNQMSEGLLENVSSTTDDWFNIHGFDCEILDTFEDEGYNGYNVLYSKDGIEIVVVELWSEQEPVMVVENRYANNLMQRVYDSFADFAADLDYKVTTQLQEGIFSKIKDKAVSLGTKLLDKLKTREAKANWILGHASLGQNKYERVGKGKFEKDDGSGGDYIPTEENKRFKHFAVMGFKNKNADGNIITVAPSFNDKKLVPGLKRCETREKYEDIEKLAKGWSAKAGNGPAFIYLSEDENSNKLVFLCQFFNGDLVKSNDQLEKYFKIARKEYEGNKAIRQAGGFQQQDDNPETDPSETDFDEV